MTLKTSTVSLGPRLHRIHAGHQATRVEFKALGGQTWRGEGGDSAAKAAVAYRLALCWNVLEGIPSERLSTGWVRDLCAAVDRGDLTEAQRISAEWGAAMDMTNGRAHDCMSCLASVDEEETQP